MVRMPPLTSTARDIVTSTARAVFRANLMEAADEAAAHGLTVLREAIHPRDRPGYFYSRVGEVAAWIEDLDRPNVRLLFDVYHVAVAEEDVLVKPKARFPIIGHVQIAAAPSRAEPDKGEICFRAIFVALEELGYAGWVGCEYKPRGRTTGLAGFRHLDSTGSAG